MSNCVIERPVGFFGDDTRPVGDQSKTRRGRMLPRDFLRLRVFARWKDGRGWKFRLDRVKG
jgi:hypothetical protein